MTKYVYGVPYIQWIDILGTIVSDFYPTQTCFFWYLLILGKTKTTEAESKICDNIGPLAFDLSS